MKTPCWRILLFLCLVLLFAGLFGCGSEETDQGGETHPPRESMVSCEDLDLQDPRTGGDFACIACRQAWEWEIAGNVNPAHFIIHLSCGVTSGAFLKILDPSGSTQWQTEVRSGHRMQYCVSLDNPKKGTHTVELCGPPPLRFTSFSGSVWINLYDHKGEIILPPGSPGF